MYICPNQALIKSFFAVLAPLVLGVVGGFESDLSGLLGVVSYCLRLSVFGNLAVQVVVVLGYPSDRSRDIVLAWPWLYYTFVTFVNSSASLLLLLIVPS